MPKLKTVLINKVKSMRDDNSALWRAVCKLVCILSSKSRGGGSNSSGALLIKSNFISSKDRNVNCIEIGEGSVLEHCRIAVSGTNSRVIIGKNCVLKYLHVVVTGDNACVLLGEGVTVNAYGKSLTKINVGDGTTCKIGERSLFSNGIGIYTTDFHKIYDMNGILLNPNKDVTIGKHTWIGLESIILKGTFIPDECVVAAGSLVTNKEFHKNQILAGRPAHAISENITWEK